jgi:succinate dehydrogenase hydrophobic anchor subunit
MILPDPIIFGRPIHVWLGLLTLLLLLFQIVLGIFVVNGVGRGTRVHFIHTKVNWIILLLIALIHGYYGFQIYFLLR